MFGKKNPANIKTGTDLAINSKIEELGEANERLTARARTAIIRQGAASLYPDGADKEKALDDLEKAKYSLLCAIGTYDGLYRDLKELLKKPASERNTSIGYSINHFSTSHEIIENAYRNFWKTP